MSALFILVNLIAGLFGTSISFAALPAGLPVWAGAALTGGVIGSQLRSRWLPAPILRHLLMAIPMVAGLKLTLT